MLVVVALITAVIFGIGLHTTAGISSADGAAGEWSVPFGDRPESSAVTCDGQSNVTISGKFFTGIGDDTSAIRISNCHNVRIIGNDFLDDAQPITVTNSTDVEIGWNRYRNITGPHERNGSNRANFTQWVNSFGGSIHDNKGIGGDTEDIISIYQSGGIDAEHPLVIERNAFEGTNWSSSTGSGIMLGDGGGGHVIVRDNILLNPGAVGIGVAGGSDIRVTGNVVYGIDRPQSNVGIYVWNQSSPPCRAIRVHNNTVKWSKPDGADGSFWNAGNCGTVVGWIKNRWQAAIDPDALRVVL